MTERTFTAAEMRAMAAVFPLQRGHEAECRCSQCARFVDALRQGATAEAALAEAQREIARLTGEVANIRAMEEQTARAYNAVRAHAGTFLAKLDECQPHIDDAFAFKAVHGIRYAGPNYGAELTTLKQALGLTAAQPTTGEPET